MVVSRTPASEWGAKNGANPKAQSKWVMASTHGHNSTTRPLTEREKKKLEAGEKKTLNFGPSSVSGFASPPFRAPLLQTFCQLPHIILESQTQQHHDHVELFYASNRCQYPHQPPHQQLKFHSSVTTTSDIFFWSEMKWNRCGDDSTRAQALTRLKRPGSLSQTPEQTVMSDFGQSDFGPN